MCTLLSIVTVTENVSIVSINCNKNYVAVEYVAKLFENLSR